VGVVPLLSFLSPNPDRPMYICVQAIDRFNTDPNDFVFMLSTKAGGVGITLTVRILCITRSGSWVTLSSS
jgi:hypothetical protein